MPGRKISVLMAVCNGEPFIADALQSVLQQAAKGLEIIVIDDGSTDGTSEVVTSIAKKAPLPIRCAYQTNQGQAKALNHALSLAAGEVIAFIDADDRWPAAGLRRHVSILVERKDVGLVIGPSRFFLDEADAPSFPRPIPPAPIVQPQLGSATFRRMLFDRLGPFNETLRGHLQRMHARKQDSPPDTGT